MTVERHPITDRRQWLEWRRHYLTASDIGAAAGVDPYKSKLRLYAEKVDDAPGSQETAAMKRGRHMELAALEYLKEEYPGWAIERPALFIVDSETRLACTPDAIAEVPDVGLVNVQIKTISRPSYERWAVDKTGKVHPPLCYELQVCCENMLLDAVHGVLCVLVVSAFDAELQRFDVPRHPAAEAGIKEIAAQFWSDVASERRPAPDFSRDADMIAALFPRSDPGKTIDLSGDNRLLEILPRREALKDTIDGAKKELEGLDAEVKYKLGDAEAAELPGWRITMREEHRREYTVPESSRRVLRVKQLEEKKEIAA